MESIELMKEKKSILRNMKNEDLQKFESDLVIAREKATALGDKDLLNILEWLSILHPFRATATSIITFLGSRPRQIDEDDEAA